MNSKILLLFCLAGVQSLPTMDKEESSIFLATKHRQKRFSSESSEEREEHEERFERIVNEIKMGLGIWG